MGVGYEYFQKTGGAGEVVLRKSNYYFEVLSKLFVMSNKKFNPIIQVEHDGLKLPDPVGSWCEKKYSLVGGYCEIFNKAIKNKFENRVYIDLFAGAGFAPVKAKNKILKTSALVSLSIPTPFTKYIFCEMDNEKIAALEARAKREHPCILC